LQHMGTLKLHHQIGLRRLGICERGGESALSTCGRKESFVTFLKRFLRGVRGGALGVFYVVVRGLPKKEVFVLCWGNWGLGRKRPLLRLLMPIRIYDG